MAGRFKELRDGWLMAEGPDYKMVAARGAANKCRKSEKKVSPAFSPLQLRQSGNESLVWVCMSPVVTD